MQTRQLLQGERARPNLQPQVTKEYDANMNVVGIRFMYHPYSLSLSLSSPPLNIANGFSERR